MRHFLIFSLIILMSCSQSKENKILEELTIQVINKEVVIPMHDQDVCSDTIILQLVNNSNIEYLFDITEPFGFFFNSKSPSKNEFIDPFGGFGIGFIDENGNYLKCDGYNSFNPEGFDGVIIEEKVYKLLPQNIITLQIPLVFPSKLDYGNYFQTVSNLQKAKKVEIFFRPVNGYLKNSDFKMESNQKIMDISERFILPIAFNCNQKKS